MKQSKFSPFCVTFALSAPMQTPKHPIMLDGLLYYIIGELHGISEAATILEKLDTMLEKSQGVYKASSMIMVRSSTQAITAGVATHATVMKWEDYNYYLGKKDRTTLVTKSGPYRNRMTKYNTVSPLALRFYGVGDIESLMFYFQSVFGLGKSVAQGYGEISEVIIESVDVDQSWIGDVTGSHCLHRWLPIEICQTLDNFDPELHEKNYLNIKPPYHIDAQVMCYQHPKQLVVVDNDYI